MKITAGILFYLLDRYENMQHICHGADRMPLKRSERFRNQKETEAGVLYIYADKKGVLLFCGEEKYKPSHILMKALKESEGGFSSLWILYDNLDENAEKNTHLADEVSEYVRQIWNCFSQIQSEILEAILSQEGVEEVLEKAQRLMRTPFTVVDRDMTLLYEHPEISSRMKAKLGESYQTELEEELLMEKEFHEAARRREPFYYYMKNLDEREYCINIFVDGYYYARLVAFAEEKKETLPSGAEQITEYLAMVLAQMIRNGYLRVNKNQNDQMHILCQRLLEGGRPEPAEIREAAAAYHWEPAQTYQVFCMEPYRASGWETQVENTMPLMTRKLEQIWQQSCAVFFGGKILWVINWTLSEKAGRPYDRNQQLIVLLRENVFRAGASSEFHDAALLASALKGAEAALESGIKKDPSYWCYRFDDYRLTFMIEAVREKKIDPLLLVHPAIPLLLEHDQEHESQLSDTLKMLLKKQGNMTQAAEALFIHRTTLFRRLNQIKDLTGLDLDDLDLMLELQLSYRFLE